MTDPDIMTRVRKARISVTVNRPEWGGAAMVRCHDWRLADWDGVPEDQLQHVVYIPGAFADFAAGAPGALLRAAAARGVPVRLTAIDLPEFQASRLPPGWTRRVREAGDLSAGSQLLLAVLARVASGPHTLVGWSTGAVHATTLAAWAPERVTAILLCMPAGFFPQSALGHLVPTFTRTTLRTLGNPAHRELIQGGRVLELNRELLFSLAKLPAIVQMCGLLATDCSVRYAAQVRCPVGFVLARGDLVFDELIPMAERGALQALFPQAPAVDVHILEEATHNAFSTHSATVAPIILDTLIHSTEPSPGGRGEHEQIL